MKGSLLKQYLFSTIPLLIAGVFALTGCSVRDDFVADNGESITYDRTFRIRGLDPAKSGDVTSSLAIGNIYEGLLEYAYLERPYVMKPMLAEALPEISKDRLVYTFKIRKGIYFQDNPCFPQGKGRELVAEDFVYSIKRVADLKNASSGYFLFNGRVKGLDDFRKNSEGEEPTDYQQEISGLRAIDRYTLRFELVAPYPQFLYVLGMHYSFAVPKEAVQYYVDDFVNNPVGTGPYELVTWKRNSRIEFARSKKWAETGRQEFYPTQGTELQKEEGFLDYAGKPIPFTDRIVQFIVDDSSTAWMMFLSGKFSFSEISSDNWDAIVGGDKSLNKDLEERGIEMISRPTLQVRYIGFNWEDPVVGAAKDPTENMKHRKLRQAMSCAYDFTQMNRLLNGRLYPLQGPVPEPLAGCLKEVSPYTYNLEKARTLFAEAGYPGGVDPKTGRRLELFIELGNADTNTRQMLELMTDFYQKVGIKLTANYNTWPGFIEKLNRRQAQLYMLGWVADFPDAENFLQLFYSQNETPGPNHSNYKNAKIDTMYEQIRTMKDSPERTKIYEEMSAIIVEDAPWIFASQPMSFALKHGWIQNFYPHDFPYGMDKYRRADQTIQLEWKQRFKGKKVNFSGKE